MKKITLLIIFALTSALTFGQVVLSEDFEAGLTLPAGWTNNDIAGGGDIWEFATGGDAVGFTSPNTIYYVNGELEGNYAVFDSDGYGNNGAAEDAAMESPVFDCSGLTSVTFSFNHGFTAGYGGTGFVEVTTNGITWTEVASFSGAAAGTDSTFGFESYDVSTELAGSATAQVRFRWTGDYSWGWAFDNVSVFQCTVSAPNAVSSAIMPANSATDVEIAYGDPRNIGPFEWAPPAAGDAPDSYNLTLGVTASGDDIGVIAGFPIGNSINYTWEPDTTYFWSIQSVNCAGTTQGPVFSFTTQACTDVSAPGVATVPEPANNSMNVPLLADGNALNLSWTGDPGANFTLNFGTVNPPDQSFNNFESGDPLSNLAENTTYYWSIDPINCVGETTGTVWTFTTGEVLSITDSEIDTFSVYPNPTSDIIKIKSSKEIDEINVFNLLGQSVAKFEKNDIVNSSISLSELTSGLYLVKISAGDTTETIRVTKE